MIDQKAIAHELHHARLARIEAQSASGDLEELLWAMRQSDRVWRRLALTGDERGELDLPPPALNEPQQFNRAA